MGTATTTTSNTGMIVSLLLSVVCLVMMCMGGWYFTYSLCEQDIAGLRSEILEQTAKSCTTRRNNSPTKGEVEWTGQTNWPKIIATKRGSV